MMKWQEIKEGLVLKTFAGDCVIHCFPPDEGYKIQTSLNKEQAAKLILALQQFVDADDQPTKVEVDAPVVRDDVKDIDREWHEEPVDFDSDEIPDLSDRFDVDDDEEDMEDYKKFQNSPHQSVHSGTHNPYDHLLTDDDRPSGGEKHNPCDDLPPANNRSLYGEAWEDTTFQQSPGEKAYGAKVALIRRLNELVGKFTETDLEDFKNMHLFLDRIQERHKDRGPVMKRTRSQE